MQAARRSGTRKARLAKEPAIAIPTESERTGKTGEVIRYHGISRETLYRWRKKYGGMQASEAKRLSPLEHEIRRIKRLVAEQALNLRVSKEPLGKDW